jgi:hypothetical protein
MSPKVIKATAMTTNPYLKAFIYSSFCFSGSPAVLLNLEGPVGFVPLDFSRFTFFG